jgi:ketosteroid isomerase-like protein
MSDLTFAEVSAGIHNTIGAYTQALDDGRTDDVVATYCPDGGCDIPGLGTFSGHDELRGAYGGWTPNRPQRHLVLNTHISSWDDEQATASSDIVFLLQGKEGWKVQIVGRYTDTLHRDGDRWLFHSRVATFTT